MRLSRELGAILIILFVFVALVLFTEGALRVVFTTFVLSFLLGHIAISAFLSKNAGIDAAERLALSFSTSIVISFFIALILNFTPPGITLNTALISIVAYFAVMGTILYWRRKRIITNERPRAPLPIMAGLLNLWSYRSRIEKIAIASIFGFTVITLSYTALSPSLPERFSEFYILNEQGKAENYPSVLYKGSELKVKIGIINSEHQMVRYRVVVSLSEQEVKTTEDIKLNHGEKWEGMVMIELTRASPNQKVEFLLYKGDDEKPYHRLHLWVDVRE